MIGKRMQHSDAHFNKRIGTRKRGVGYLVIHFALHRARTIHGFIVARYSRFGRVEVIPGVWYACRGIGAEITRIPTAVMRLLQAWNLRCQFLTYSELRMEYSGSF